MNAKNNKRLKLFGMVLLCLPALGFATSLTFGQKSEPIVSGQLKKWHRITITFNGPMTSEDAEINPFLDCRLDVIFTNGKKQYKVAGFYAADGNAGETSATSGNKWRIHFVPDEQGSWNYSAIFAQGADIAIQPF